MGVRSEESVPVPSTENPEKLVWENACTNEVQNCRQVAATNTVILEENPNCETSETSGHPAARYVTLRAKGHLEQEPQPFQKRTWSIVPCSRDLPDNVELGFFQKKKRAWLTRHARKRENDGASSWKQYVRIVKTQIPNLIRGLNPYQILAKLTCQKKDRKYTKFAGKKDQR